MPVTLIKSKWSSGELYFYSDPDVGNKSVHIGDGTTNTDLTLHASAASTYIKWDASANKMLTSGKVDVDYVGSAASTYMRWDASANKLLTSGKVDAQLTGSSAGGYLLWDASKNQFLLRASGADDRALMNMGVLSVPPTTGVDQGDLFVIRSGTTFRLGVVTTGTTKQYLPKFQYTKGSAS